MFTKTLLTFLTIVTLVTSVEARQNSSQQKEIDSNKVYNHTIRAFMAENKQIEQLVYNAAIYAVFPSIGKGGLIFGGAYGEGRVFRKGVWIGRITMSQYTIGLQVGGQAYSEIIFFKTEEAFATFVTDGLISGTQSSIVGGSAGASGDVNIDSDILTFTSDNDGLMFEASTGAQNFTYTPGIY